LWKIRGERKEDRKEEYRGKEGKNIGRQSHDKGGERGLGGELERLLKNQRGRGLEWDYKGPPIIRPEAQRNPRERAYEKKSALKGRGGGQVHKGGNVCENILA